MGIGTGKSKRSSQQRPRGLLSRPLDSLFLLLPLIVFYELACLLLEMPDLRAADHRVVAFHLLQVFFELFGTDFAWMPGLAVVIILLATHIVSRQPWRFRKRVVGLMYLEAVAWALPLIAVNHFTRMAAGGLPAPNWVGDMALCVGAGIYEELIFRLVLISFLVMIGSDLLRFSSDTTMVAAVFISAVVFALHHHPPLGAEPFSPVRFIFRCIAGVYLGGIFVFRGYGPAAGAHIAHNLLILTFAD